MKKLVAGEVVILAVLTIIALLLNKEHRSLQLKAEFEKNYVIDNQQKVLRSIAGIDVAGRLVSEIIPSRTGRFVAFALRHSTLQNDIDVWKTVNILLAKEPANILLDIHLVGYCDGTLCAESVSNNAGQQLGFPVIVYGDLMSTQAIYNADAEGNCLVIEPRRLTREIRWRNPDLTVACIVQEIIK